MRRSIPVVVLVFAALLAISTAAMAAQGTWKSYASDSTGKLTDTDSQVAYYKTRIGGVQQPEVKLTGLEWSGSSSDYSSTTTDGGTAVWNVNDSSGGSQHKTWITPASFDASRGIVMAKIKWLNSSSVNLTFGFSTATGYGMQVALRGSAMRIRTGEGGNTVSDPANVSQADYRVYALSWVGNRANVWYSNGTDWSANSADWTQVATNWMMAGGTGTMEGGSPLNGMVLYTGNSNTWNGNIQYVAHSTYDNVDGEVTPWDFNPAVEVVPEPCSLLALGGALIGLVVRRKRA